MIEADHKKELQEKENGQWKLQHYHLAITVPNEKVQAYLDLLKEE